MLLYLRLLSESFSFAINALRNNKLRTLLSLLGVTIGIFSIIAVLAAVDSMDKKIKEDLSDMDMNTIYLIRFSFGPSEVPRWKREQFPDVTYEEYEHLRRNVKGIDKMSFQVIRNENFRDHFLREHSSFFYKMIHLGDQPDSHEDDDEDDSRKTETNFCSQL